MQLIRLWPSSTGRLLNIVLCDGLYRNAWFIDGLATQPDAAGKARRYSPTFTGKHND
ncbi:hypothetical protein [Verminephrobacter eiseniae]|uniref:hypothetical protein n=1 Tax=Verminephrobacter eiseniae TaxID=364317 RepID=UPI0022379736|nr:hypothetical protein [Verminephrobacter eiseniae]